MKFSTRARTNPTRNRAALYVAAGLVVVYLGYFAFLQKEENTARENVAAMHQSDATRYLESVDALQGFDAYFAEFAKIHDYTRPRDDVPPFLVGRWAMFDAPKQVQESYIPQECGNALMIEDGRVRILGEKAASFDVKYSIVADVVLADTAGGETIRIAPVAYSNHIHHLVVDLPDSEQPVYAYLCK